MSDGSATPSQLRALKEERALMREGYSFLDEKRLLLAAEILRELDLYETREREYRDAQGAASSSLAAAVERHGLDDLQLYPVTLSETSGSVDERRLLGVRLVEARMASTSGAPVPVAPTPEAERCAHAFHELVTRSTVLAALTGNLERLLADYRRTARRARALEDVILPEINAGIRGLEGRLEEIDQEEALRALAPSGSERHDR